MLGTETFLRANECILNKEEKEPTLIIQDLKNVFSNIHLLFSAKKQVSTTNKYQIVANNLKAI